MSADPRRVASPSGTGGTATVRPATDQWGCAAVRCLNAARFIITLPNGSEWGACASHTQAVKKLAKENARHAR